MDKSHAPLAAPHPDSVFYFIGYVRQALERGGQITEETWLQAVDASERFRLETIACEARNYGEEAQA